MGIHHALPDAEIVGVDIAPQKRYPFTFVHRDALEFVRERGVDFDFFWASPPCQKYSSLQRFTKREYPDLLPPTRKALIATGKPWVIENVYGAPLNFPIRLCGLSFDLPLYRHRYFETSFGLLAPPHISHDEMAMRRGEIYPVHGHPGGKREKRSTKGAYYSGSTADWKRAMGIDWMIAKELVEAIPPAYSEYILRQWATSFLSTGS